MKKVITYGTFDLLHHGHIRLLERAKQLGDYLIVGVISNEFDRTLGKTNIQQSLLERVEAIKNTGIADEIIVEEYEGQRIEDILNHNVDIFVAGSDWTGHFDYLKKYCEVVYLDRTEGISSSKLRENYYSIKLGIVSEGLEVSEITQECQRIAGIKISGIFAGNQKMDSTNKTVSFDELVTLSDALYIVSNSKSVYEQIKQALTCGKHVMYKCFGILTFQQSKELIQLANINHCILINYIDVAFRLAFLRMVLFAKSEKIGKIVSIEVTTETFGNKWDVWATSMVPIFQLLGCNYKSKRIIAKNDNSFTKIEFDYEGAIASIKICENTQTQSQLIISGSEGYIVVPSNWWNKNYFEVRHEDVQSNQRYFYPQNEKVTHNELLTFMKSIEMRKNISYVDSEISIQIASVIEDAKKQIDWVGLK